MSEFEIAKEVIVGREDLIALTKRFDEFVDVLAIDTNGDVSDPDVVRSGRYLLPQEGPVPYDSLTAGIIAYYGETVDDYSEASTLRIADGEEEVFVITHENGSFYFFANNGNDLTYDEAGGVKRVKHVLDWLSAGNLEADPDTARAMNRYSEPSEYLERLGRETIDGRTPEAGPMVFQVYDRLFRMLYIEDTEQGFAFSIKSKWFVAKDEEDEQPTWLRRCQRYVIGSENDLIFFDWLEAGRMEDDKWNPMPDKTLLTSSDQEEVELFVKISQRLIYMLERKLPSDQLVGDEIAAVDMPQLSSS